MNKQDVLNYIEVCMYKILVFKIHSIFFFFFFYKLLDTSDLFIHSELFLGFTVTAYFFSCCVYHKVNNISCICVCFSYLVRNKVSKINKEKNEGICLFFYNFSFLFYNLLFCYSS